MKQQNPVIPGTYRMLSMSHAYSQGFQRDHFRCSHQAHGAAMTTPIPHKKTKAKVLNGRGPGNQIQAVGSSVSNSKALSILFHCHFLQEAFPDGSGWSQVHLQRPGVRAPLSPDSATGTWGGKAPRCSNGGKGGVSGAHLGGEVMLLQLPALPQVPGAHGVVQASGP